LIVGDVCHEAFFILRLFFLVEQNFPSEVQGVAGLISIGMKCM